MTLKNGEKVFIITRRLFEKDLRRHFIGEVLESTETTARVRKYTFVYDDASGDFVRRQELRTRVFSLIDARPEKGLPPVNPLHSYEETASCLIFM